MDASSSRLARNHAKSQYEVFISFHGGDVRRGFLSHLIRALKLKQINAFDDTKLKRTEGFATELLRIIKQSDLSIVIFSQKYPTSKYCMMELQEIHECMKDVQNLQGKFRNFRKHRAFPVFYEVDTSDVQNLQGNYEVMALMEQKWKDALEIISCTSGADHKNFLDEAELVDYVVENVSKVLSEPCPDISHHEGLFGINSSIMDVEEILCFDSMNDVVRMVGIWGMGGIGKTTIADKVFHGNKMKFEGHCFVSNVREQFLRDGPMSLREKIIRGLLKDENLEIVSSPSADETILRRIKRVKVLLVLDDVSDCLQLKSLLGNGLYSPNAFCPGSRIIVTTKDRQVAQDVVFKSVIYEVKKLEDKEAVELFCWTAFGKSKPEKGYKKLSKNVVRYAGGVPQVLIILGSSLKNKSKNFWEKALEKCSTTSPLGVQDFLRININQGLDFEEKSIFLDIACFLKGYTRYYVENMLETFGFHAKVGIDRLVDKSLVKEEEKEYGEVIITMHDLLEQTGHEIVSEEKQSKGHKSRLCTFDDIKDTLTNNTGTGNVEVISLYFYGDSIIEINSEAFIHMSKLRCLIFKSDSLSQAVNCPIVKPGLEFLPNSIKYLQWDNFSQNGWPSKFDAEKLVELHLKRSHLTEIIWSKPLPRLKLIVLSESKDLKKISDLAMAPNLDVIDLSHCSSFVDIGTSLHNLHKLMKLNVRGCERLSNLPALPCSLVKLVLARSGIKQFPSTIGCLTHLKELSLQACRLKRLPSSISSLISLEVLDLSYCKRLVEIKSTFENLKKLTRLDVCYCTHLSLLPELPSSIAEFGVIGSGLKQLPETVGHLTNLKGLCLNSCRELKSLPSSFCNLSSIEMLDISYCTNLIKLPQNFGNLILLKELYVSYSGLTELPTSIQKLKNLIKLEMKGCQELTSLPSLPSNIELFLARGCKSQFNEVKTSMVKQYKRKVLDQPTEIHRLCVDDEMQVPEWMKYRYDCGVTTVSFDPKTVADSTNLIFFVVISSISLPDWVFAFSSIIPVAILTYGKRQTYESCAYSSSRCPRIAHDDGENLFYFILWNCNIACKSLKKVSFKLYGPKDGKIIKCGVHPILDKKSCRKRTHLEDEKHHIADKKSCSKRTHLTLD